MVDPQREDPLHTMMVDEVTRDDGRYLIYYGWPDGGTDADAAPSALHPDDEVLREPDV